MHPVVIALCCNVIVSLLLAAVFYTTARKGSRRYGLVALYLLNALIAGSAVWVYHFRL